MHSTIYNEFRNILAELQPSGRCLEIGAVPAKNTLLTLDCISHMERIGINLRAGRYDSFDILQANANDMHMFPAGHFDLILSNAMLEHDKSFGAPCRDP